MSDLVREVRAFVAAHPAESGDLLRAIADGLKDYEAAQKAQRGALADMALRSMMTLLRRPSLQKGPHALPYYIDVVQHQYPKGLTGHSDTERKFWDNFLDVILTEGADYKWLKEVKGYDCVEWWDRVVIPALAERATPAVAALRNDEEANR